MLCLLLLVFYFGAVLGERCNTTTNTVIGTGNESSCVAPPSYWILNVVNHGDYNTILPIFDETTKNIIYVTISKVESVICNKSLNEIMEEFEMDNYMEPNTIVQTIVAIFNSKIKGACLSYKSESALNNMIKELFLEAPTHVQGKTLYTKSGCSRGYLSYKSELDKNAMPKSLARTLYLYNNGQSGPQKCN